LQRSPSMRGVQFYKKDPVTFEVVEMNGRCEAVKMMTPKMVEQEQARARGELVDEEAVKPDPKELVGQRVEGIVQGQYQLMLKQKWGFVTSDAFAGKVFWHITESPDMQEVEFERESYVEFDIVYDNARGGANDIRARNMKYMRPPANSLSRGRQIATQRDRKKAEMAKNWRKGPPPDWDCKHCGFHNFGRQKECKNCGVGKRPPREEWPAEEEGAGAATGEEHQPMVLPPPKMGGPYGDDPITQPGWFPDSWKKEEPKQEQEPWNASQGKLLPFTNMDGDSGLQGKIDLLVSTFTDVIENHNPRKTGETMIFKLRALMQEVNEVLGNDRSSKHAFSMELAKHAWFTHNGYEVRFQPSKNKLGISQKNARNDDDEEWGPAAKKAKTEDDDWGW